MKRTLTRKLSLALFLGMGVGLLWAQQGSSQQVPADNTKVNQRDRDRQELTADQQKETSSDRQLTQQIRRAIIKDKSLSSAAHNVKIVTRNGTVTLKGPVKSEDEKQAIESKANQIAGGGKVTSELQVVTGK